MLKKLLAWRKIATTPKEEPNEVDTAVNLVLQMAKLMDIDPQKIVDGMQARLEIKEVPTSDSDIDAVVNNSLAEGFFYAL